jgi:bile acid:Na+ symporter, BASS family
VLACVLLDLEPAIKIALVALAVSLVPPLLPGKQISAGGTPDYAVGLLVSAAVVAIVLVPLSIELMEYAFPFELYISPKKVASIAVLSIFAPLVIGLIIQRLMPRIDANRLSVVHGRHTPTAGRGDSGPSQGLADLARLFGNGLVLSLVLFAAVGLAIGHALGAPQPERPYGPRACHRHRCYCRAARHRLSLMNDGSLHGCFLRGVGIYEITACHRGSTSL